jgi:hypothetical protein
MFRRTLPLFFGSPPAKRVPHAPFLHASQRPGAPERVDYASLGLTYPVQNLDPQFTIPKICWAPRPTSLPDLPFAVDRVEKTGGFPVYPKYHGGGRTKKITEICKIRGDGWALYKEIKKLVGGEKDVLIKPGKIIIDGNYHRRVKLYLLAMGF